MINFRTQHPEDLVSRLFMLHFLRRLGANKVYNVVEENYRKNYFYMFLDKEDKKMIDYNWEALLFKATLTDLENIIEPLVDEVEKLDKEEEEKLVKLIEAKTQENSIADISIYDLAQAEINRSKDTSRLILPK